MGVYRACPDWTIEIVGTDLNTKVLEKARGRRLHRARRAECRGPTARSILRARRQDFALPTTIKKRVTFEFGNLTRTPMPSTGPAGRRVLQERRDLFPRRGDAEAVRRPPRHARARRLSAARPCRVAVADVGWILRSSSTTGRSATGRRRRAGLSLAPRARLAATESPRATDARPSRRHRAGPPVAQRSALSKRPTPRFSTTRAWRPSAPATGTPPSRR